jgi:hypothetical protein
MPLIYYLGSNTGPFVEYSCRKPFSLASNISITFDTKKNIFNKVIFCGSNKCTNDEDCKQNVCIHRGSLNFLAQWSPRKGQGHLIVRTPLNNTIHFGKPHTKSSLDESQHQKISDDSQIDNIYWALNSTSPDGFYKICFSTGNLMNGTDKLPLNVTIEIKRSGKLIETMRHTFNKSTAKLDECIDTSDTFIGTYSTGMLHYFSKLLSMYKTVSLVVCKQPYALTPSATCANILTDRNHCGKIGHKCDATYKSCSGGVCGMLPTVQLTQPNIIWQGAINGSQFGGSFVVNLPFNISLYNTITDYVTVMSNGVSLLFLTHCS